MATNDPCCNLVIDKAQSAEAGSSNEAKIGEILRNIVASMVHEIPELGKLPEDKRGMELLCRRFGVRSDKLVYVMLYFFIKHFGP